MWHSETRLFKLESVAKWTCPNRIPNAVSRHSPQRATKLNALLVLLFTSPSCNDFMTSKIALHRPHHRVRQPDAQMVVPQALTAGRLAQGVLCCSLIT
jgi:hypothetical protein